MKILKYLAICSLTFCSSTLFAAQATDQQVEKLIQVLNLDEILQSTIVQIRPQIDQHAYAVVQNITQNKNFTPQQQIIANELADKIYAESKSQTAWEKLKPVYLKIYKDVYDAQEVQAQIEFYSSSTGQSILKKSPLVAQESMKIMNQQLGSTLQSSEKNFADIQQKLNQLKIEANKQK